MTKPIKQKPTKKDVKKKVKAQEELNQEEQSILAEIKLGQKQEYKEYVRKHNRELRRLENEAKGVFEPNDDY